VVSSLFGKHVGNEIEPGQGIFKLKITHRPLVWWHRRFSKFLVPRRVSNPDLRFPRRMRGHFATLSIFKRHTSSHPLPRPPECCQSDFFVAQNLKLKADRGQTGDFSLILGQSQTWAPVYFSSLFLL
jgi:hypothetical protein